ncbi:MAG: carbon-nitrogen hydrolase family protein [Alicyclobacillus sp.]|nr:carbon-nitrogen hydrolase family protein [Alicyclobacillus sp.]
MSFRITLAQLGSTDDKQLNLDKAEAAVRQATDERDSHLVVFPEVFMSHFPAGTPHDVVRADSEPIDGPFVQRMSRLAQSFGAWLVFGMREAAEDAEDNRVYNTTLIVDASGATVGVYRKTHLYDAFGARESEHIKPGHQLFEPIQTPFGKLGMFVCYELRFPEIARYQAVRGADIIVVPSGWVRGPEKEHHWQTLVTARALENTVFVAAADQVSDHYCGNSLVVDPMGIPIASGAETEGLVTADIDLERIAQVRRKLPSSAHRRPELYGVLGR